MSQKPDALPSVSGVRLEPCVPAIQAAKAANVPTIVIDDARTVGASTYIGTDQVGIGAKAADYLHKL